MPTVTEIRKPLSKRTEDSHKPNGICLAKKGSGGSGFDGFDGGNDRRWDPEEHCPKFEKVYPRRHQSESVTTLCLFNDAPGIDKLN